MGGRHPTAARVIDQVTKVSDEILTLYLLNHTDRYFKKVGFLRVLN